MSFDITMQSIFIGGLEIRFYSLMILSGLLVGVVIGQREARRLGEDPEHVVNIAVIGAILALIGARMYHVLDRDQWPYYRDNPGQIVAIWNGGIGIFGAIAGAAVGLLVYVWWVNRSARLNRRPSSRMNVLRWFDIGAPSFLIGQAIGRWGNFFNEELFGPPTDLPWGIPIDVANRPLQYAADTHFHPLFFYESVLSLIGVVVLLYVARRFAQRIVVGDIFFLYFAWYGVERFVLEFLRTDNWKYGAVPMAQIVGVIFVVSAIALIVLRHRMAHDSGDAPGAEDTDGAPSRSTLRRRRRRTESEQDG
jgi:phosphatidylglycerol:prolipoprotein diacylglycerol transferase